MQNGVGVSYMYMYNMYMYMYNSALHLYSYGFNSNINVVNFTDSSFYLLNCQLYAVLLDMLCNRIHVLLALQ